MKKLRVFAIIVFVLFCGTLAIIAINNKNERKEREKFLIDSVAKSIKQSFPVKFLLGYSVVQYDSEAKADSLWSMPHYKGVAVLCDNLGFRECDSIHFVCFDKPKLGKARFWSEFDSSTGKFIYWVLFAQ